MSFDKWRNVREFPLLSDNAVNIQVWVSNHFPFLFMTIIVFVIIFVLTSPHIHFYLLFSNTESRDALQCIILTRAAIKYLNCRTE